jgi:hypothetical protein
VLLGGGSLTLNLDADGTTTGHLFVPGGGEAGKDLDLWGRLYHQSDTGEVNRSRRREFWTTGWFENRSTTEGTWIRSNCWWA